MHVIVYGAGAVGGVIGGRLAQHGHDVVLIARGAHFEAIRKRGLELRDPERSETLAIATVERPGDVRWRADDFVVLAMKTQDTAAALDELAANAPPELPIFCAQNGVENERIALRRFTNVYAICVMLPAQHLEPGIVEASSIPITGLLDVGRYPEGIDAHAEELAAVLSKSTFESVPRADIMRWKYRKLLMNLGNAVEALCRRDDADALSELTRRARREGHAVLEAAGIAVASGDEDRERRGDRLKLDPRAGARGGGSSWQSLRRGTGTIESDFLNGEIALLGRMHGVPTPVNALLQLRANEAARSGTPPGTLSPADLLRDADY
jgi:2-dehydropantoate 2-reductase